MNTESLSQAADKIPVIGLVPDVDLYRNRGVDFARYFLYAENCQRLYEAGAQPLVLPYPPDDFALDALLDPLDGLMLIGGDFDIDPRRYGEKMHPKLGTLKPDRNNFEFRLFDAARARNIPVLGLCAGMQLINVAHGGTLYQDLKSQQPTRLDHEQQHNRKVPAHAVEIQSGSLLHKICGGETLDVNSTHHQAVKELGQGLRLAAISEDGLIEAVEALEGAFCLGVQWHPETLEQSPPAARHLAIFKAFVEAAKILSSG